MRISFFYNVLFGGCLLWRMLSLVALSMDTTKQSERRPQLLPGWVATAVGMTSSPPILVSSTEDATSSKSVLESIHEEYLQELEEGFRTFGTGATDCDAQMIWQDEDFRQFAVDRGNAGPDEEILTNGNVMYQTKQPVLSPEECAALIAEAQQVIRDGLLAEPVAEYDSDDTMTVQDDDNKEKPASPTNSQLGEARVSQLPIARQWLKTVLHTRLFPLLSSRFGIAAQDLTLQDGLIIGYGFPNQFGSRSQPIHRDSCLVSLNIALSPLSNYTQGCTFFEATPSDLPNGILYTEQGHATCHAGGLSHAGRGIGPDGTRWVLVLFVICRGHPEYARRSHARGMSTSDDEALMQGLALAPRDHLLWTSLGRRRMDDNSTLATDLCLALAAQSYAYCGQADLALGRRFLARRRPRAALRRFDRVLACLEENITTTNTEDDPSPSSREGIWPAYRAMGWDARYYGAQAGLLCTREALRRPGAPPAMIRSFLQVATARCQALQRIVRAQGEEEEDPRLLGMIAFAENLWNASAS